MTEHEKLLFQLINNAAEKYRAQAERLKVMNYTFRILTLILAASSTVILGLTVDTPGYLCWSRNLALVFGAVSTFVIGLSAFWNLETYWIQSKVLHGRLSALSERCLFQQSKTGSLSTEEINQGFDEYRAIMDGKVEYWEKLAKQAQSQAKEPSSPQQP